MAQTIKELKEQSASLRGEVTEIHSLIHDEVSNAGIDATSESKVREFGLWEMVFATLSWLMQSLWDKFKIALQAIADAAPTCNDRWFATEVKIFQYGHELLFNEDTGKYYYETTDTDAQIIDRVAVADQSEYGVIKVAKAGPLALTTAELNAFKSFIARIQPFGTNIAVISQAADLLKLPLDLVYDAIIPSDTLVSNVEAAVNAYLAELSDFDGTFRLIKLIDKIQDVEGVVDVIAGTIEAKQDGQAYTEVDRNYTAVSGYIDIDPAFPLDTTITYTPA